MSKKTVLKLDIHCDKCKRKALKTVAGVPGVDSVAIDMKEKKITVTGEADPVCLTTKLRKFGFTELLAVGPVKEEKKDDKKQGEQKKDPVAPTVVYLPKSCNRCDGFYALSDENPNACRIS